jgi:hypothetical protein
MGATMPPSASDSSLNGTGVPPGGGKESALLVGGVIALAAVLGVAAFIGLRGDASQRGPKIRVKVVGDIAGFDVYRDDTKLDPAMFGVALPVDPGPHTVTTRRDSKVLEESRVESKEKGMDEVTFDATGLPAPSLEQRCNRAQSPP